VIELLELDEELVTTKFQNRNRSSPNRNRKAATKQEQSKQEPMVVDDDGVVEVTGVPIPMSTATPNRRVGWCRTVGKRTPPRTRTLWI